jgi:uncharacterized protein (DUF305 family)
MKRSARLVIAVFLMSIVALPEPQHSGSQSNQMAKESAWAEFMGSMNKMQHAMESTVPSGDNDVDFVRLMISHHQSAIDMAKIELVHGKDPQMRRLAQEVVTDQQSEIDLMQLWLQRHAGSSK